MRPFLVGVFAVLAGCAHRPECAAHGGPPWTELASEHFLVRTNLPLALARENVTALESSHAAVRRSFKDLPGLDQHRITVVLLRNEYEVQDLISDDFAVGSVQHDWAGTVVVLGADEYLGVQQPYLPVINTALALHFAQFAWRRAPRWLLEGQARFLGTLTIDLRERTARRGKADKDLVPLARRWGLLSLEELWTWDHESSSLGLRMHRLVSAWAWVHYLFHAHRERLRQFIGALEQGDQDPKQVWATVFAGLDAEQLRSEAEVRLFGGPLPGQMFEVEFETKPPVERPLKSTEVHATLARVGAVNGQWERAAQEAALAIKLSPDHPRAREAQLISEKDPARRLALARRHAVREDTDAVAAVLLALNLPEGDERTTTLERAIELDPESAIALSELAMERLRQRRVQEANSLAERAVLVAPYSLRVLVTRATVLGVKGDCAQAAATLRRAIDLARLEPGTERRNRLDAQLSELQACAAGRSAEGPAPERDVLTLLSDN